MELATKGGLFFRHLAAEVPVQQEDSHPALARDAAGLDDDESQEVLFTVMKEWEDGWSGVPGHEGVASSEALFNHVCQILKEDGQVSTPAPPRMIMICPMLALAFPWDVSGRIFS